MRSANRLPSAWPWRHGAAACLAGLCGTAGAQQAAAGTEAVVPPATPPAETIVISATRTRSSAFDLPASTDRIAGDALRDARMQAGIAEVLGGVPGLLARDRQNYAQDVQVSVRGYGARASFGIRGVRLYVDGIPATLPDGQGQLSHVDLASAARIDVLRGPFSALYGNSAGGVILVQSEDGAGPLQATLTAAGGSDGIARAAVKLGGASGAWRYVASVNEFVTQGWREHSAAERRLANAKLRWDGDSASVTVVVNSMSLPKAQDPLGLTRAQFDADPRAVDPSATQFDTRKTVDQTQLGVVVELRGVGGTGGTLRALAYRGQRRTEQYQAIPVATQASPLHPGGVIVLDRDYGGGDLRWTHESAPDGRPLTVAAGFAYDRLGEHRLGYQNFAGTVLGVQGALRRDEDNRASNADPYLQAAWQWSERWQLTAGVRRTRVAIASTDRYITAANPDDSGSVRHTATLPAAGLMFAADRHVHLYATAGRGLETPTLNELAYRPGGGSGLNLALASARSQSVEAGIKTRFDAAGDVDFALFDTRTRDEIVTITNVGGRATYGNGGRTRRRGAELAWSRDWGAVWQTRVAAAWLDARYRDGFVTCTAAPCTAANVPVAAGNRLPGLARQTLSAAVTASPWAGWRTAVEARWLARVPVNDANTDAAAGHAVAGASLSYRGGLGGAADSVAAPSWNAFIRVDNLFARRYAGSVIVNEGNARYFEPAPGRTWAAGASASIGF